MPETSFAEIWFAMQGEPGANALKGPFNDVQKAIDDFTKKFYDKTHNQWCNREQFKPVAGKYTLLEMGDEEEAAATPVQPVS